MDPVTIYGLIPDKSSIILGVGNYNSIHGVLTYLPTTDLLQMTSLSNIITPTVLELIVTYETPVNQLNQLIQLNQSNKLYFSLMIKNQDQKDEIKRGNRYINIRVENNRNVACIALEKAIFCVDYSSADRVSRNQLLAGSLYSLQTAFEGVNHIVSWKIHDFSNCDLIVFLPTTWYEADVNASCQMKSGTATLIESLNQSKFKGYSSQDWCVNVPEVVHCIDDKQCGSCLGPCPGDNELCYPNNNGFTCQSINSQSSTPSTTGTNAALIAIVAIIVIVIFLVWIFTRRD
jgi:hypothetical protein